MFNKSIIRYSTVGDAPVYEALVYGATGESEKLDAYVMPIVR